MYIKSIDPKQILKTIIQNFGKQLVVISVAEHSAIDLKALIDCLVEQNIPFIGGIFPKVISGMEVYDDGMILTSFPNVEETYLVRGLESGSFSIPKINLEEDEDYFLFTFADGLTAYLSLYLSELYTLYGNKVSYIGAGTGSLSLKQMPCVFDKTGIYQDAAVGLIAKSKVALGVKHGWKRIAGPYVATKTNKNTVQEINWQPAFEVYKSIIREHSQKEITPNNFSSIAKAYPFGILKDNSEYVVRDPLTINDKGEIICVGEVVENTVLDILNGDNQNLIEAAEDSASQVINQLKNPKHAYISDCISRILFLEDDYHLELKAISEKLVKNNRQIPVEGALTLGEISSFGDSYLQLFNKTVVIGLFE
ncbi:FIST C-terminal domain-containing protein [uncultured Roseivirga sp.]|uniref:FIST signal transduction protein n=1 Tax=uncultured Roseivirga sp. TaxID=543088 RepID=UPI0030DD7816|tara:strand:+ start:760 stop:1857 length:1098 start_codon:yes stop_codon:yes gene_type:complete